MPTALMLAGAVVNESTTFAWLLTRHGSQGKLGKAWVVVFLTTGKVFED